MQKKFLSSLGLILLLNLLVKPIYILGIDAEVQNRVGQEAYGLYFAILNLGFIFNILIDLGINNFNNRNISQNTQLLDKHFSKLLTLKAMLALVYALVTFVLGVLLGFAEQHKEMLLFIILNQVLISFILFTRSNLAALQLFTQDSIMSVLDRGLMILFCGLLLFTTWQGSAFDIIWFVYLQTLTYGITLLAGLVFIRGRQVRVYWSPDRPFGLQIIRKSIPYALFILTGSMYTRLDGVMISRLLPDGDTQAGFYAQGYRFYEAAGMFAYLFAVLLLPIYSRMLKNHEAVRPVVELSARILLGIGLYSAILFLYQGDWLLHWRYVEVTTASVQAFSLLMFAFVGWCMFYIYGTLMTANENLRSLNIISAVGLLVNVILNFILIPRYQVVGAAAATMCTQIFAGGAQMIFVTRRFQLGFNSWMVLQFVIFAVGFASLAHYIDTLYIEPAWRMLLTALAGIALLFITKVVRPLEMLKVLKS